MGFHRFVVACLIVLSLAASASSANNDNLANVESEAVLELATESQVVAETEVQSEEDVAEEIDSDVTTFEPESVHEPKNARGGMGMGMGHGMGMGMGTKGSKKNQKPQIVTTSAGVCNPSCHFGGSAQGTLGNQATLNAGQAIHTADGTCDVQAVMQTDGNFVVYLGGKALWSSGTSGKGGNRVVMQGDGNLVIYTASNAPVWSSNTAGRSSQAPFRLIMQYDHNLVIYNAANQAVWNSGTSVGACACNYQCYPSSVTGVVGTLGNGGTLSAGQSITANDGQCGLQAVMQGDGNFVLYGSDGHAFWSTVTSGKGGNRIVMQGDGNLVIYTASNAPVWQSGTSGLSAQAPFRLVLQTDHNLVIYNAAGHAVWSARTSVGACGAAPPPPAPPSPPPATGSNRQKLVACGQAVYNNRYHMTYTEGGQRWSGIAEHIYPPNAPPYSDCSSTVTWCYWTVFGNGPDFVNNDNWAGGYTGTMAANSQLIDCSQLKPGDIILYGSGYPWDHVEMYMGNGQTISHGADPASYESSSSNQGFSTHQCRTYPQAGN